MPRVTVTITGFRIVRRDITESFTVVESCDSALAATAQRAATMRVARKLGGLEGKIWIADDFDETDEELVALFEGAEDEEL